MAGLDCLLFNPVSPLVGQVVISGACHIGDLPATACEVVFCCRALRDVIGFRTVAVASNSTRVEVARVNIRCRSVDSGAEKIGGQSVDLCWFCFYSVFRLAGTFESRGSRHCSQCLLTDALGKCEQGPCSGSGCPRLVSANAATQGDNVVLGSDMPPVLGTRRHPPGRQHWISHSLLFQLQS